jgi:hypothetical protein
MSAEDYARNAERVEQARRLIDLLELAYREQAFDLALTIERQLALLLGLNAPTHDPALIAALARLDERDEWTMR